MKPFFQAVWHSLRYRWEIAGALTCSLLIAVIWSASITTVFPVVKIVLEGETVETWIEHEIENGHVSIAAVKREIDELKEQHAAAPEESAFVYANKLDLKKNRLTAEEKSLEWYQEAQPILRKYAPKSAFQTLVVALIWLLSVTAIKGILLVIGAILVARVANRTVMDLRESTIAKRWSWISGGSI